MRIAFDLDNTLIPYGDSFETSRPSVLSRAMGVEGLRLGTNELIDDLKNRGHEIFVYTSSYRSASKIRRTFRSHGIKLDGIINQQKHDKHLKENRTKYTKYPPAFGIDILIDDSKGVEIEGQRHDFTVIQIEPDNLEWTKVILEKVSLLARTNEQLK